MYNIYVTVFAQRSFKYNENFLAMKNKIVKLIPIFIFYFMDSHFRENRAALMYIAFQAVFSMAIDYVHFVLSAGQLQIYLQWLEHIQLQNPPVPEKKVKIRHLTHQIPMLMQLNVQMR